MARRLEGGVGWQVVETAEGGREACTTLEDILKKRWQSDSEKLVCVSVVCSVSSVIRSLSVSSGMAPPIVGFVFPYHLGIKKMPMDLSTGQFDRGNSLIESSSS